MRVLCVGRHRFLSEHFGRCFDAFGVETVPCVGIENMTRIAPEDRPDAIVCDYDLLTTIPFAAWASNPMLSGIPMIVVSLTRHPAEAHLPDRGTIAGFLYLPGLEPADAHRVLAAVRQTTGGISPPHGLQWPDTTRAAQYR